MSKKVVVRTVGTGNAGKPVAEQIAKHDFIPDVIICDTKPKEIIQTVDLQNKLSGTMLASYADYEKPKGSNKQAKKKKRKKNKKTHR